MRPDDTATAGPDGAWHMDVRLEEGRNELTFRLGDDESTEQQLVIVYDPALALASESPTARPTRSPSPSARPTRSPSPSLAATTPSAAPSGGDGTAEDVTSFARRVCSGTRYDGCVEDIVLVSEQVPGSLVAICEYGEGLGEIVLIDSEGEAEEECSAGGLIAPSEVFDVVEVPGV